VYVLKTITKMKIVQTDHFLRNSSNKLKKKIILLAEDKNNIL
jgi:hypothetical protein